MDVDLSEEDQMMRAIAMSLGQNMSASADQPTAESGRETAPVDEENKPTNVEPLQKDTLDDFTESLMPGLDEI
jgi:hypothetical protein